MSQVQTENPVRLEWNEDHSFFKNKTLCSPFYWVRCPDCGETAEYSNLDKVIECRAEECKLMRWKFGHVVKI